MRKLTHLSQWLKSQDATNINIVLFGSREPFPCQAFCEHLAALLPIEVGWVYKLNNIVNETLFDELVNHIAPLEAWRRVDLDKVAV